MGSGWLGALIPALLATIAPPTPPGGSVGPCALELVVLGAGQDAGAPQIGNADDAGPRLLPSSLALLDRANGKRYLFDATPAITEQLAALDAIEPPGQDQGPDQGLGLDGVFLTHAHIGHYLGLAYLGREAAGARNVPVYAMPRMEQFLRANGPWSQLVELGNISLRPLSDQRSVPLAGGVSVTPMLVPHRDEYSETVGFLVRTPHRRALYIPDIDSWDAYVQATGYPLEDMLYGTDYAFIDATFWDDNELKGRDMSAIPHPRVARVMDRLQALPASQRAKVRFIHYNHTNPIRDPESVESREVAARGYAVARRGEKVCLSLPRAG